MLANSSNNNATFLAYPSRQITEGNQVRKWTSTNLFHSKSSWVQ